MGQNELQSGLDRGGNVKRYKAEERDQTGAFPFAPKRMSLFASPLRNHVRSRQ
jgi:hypothetical protein